MHRLLNSSGAGDRDDRGALAVKISGTKNFIRGRELFMPSLARQVLKIFERGPFIYRNGAFRNEESDVIYMQSVLALYERYLVKIMHDSRHRTRQTLLLTEIGQHVALNLQREKFEERNNLQSISEESALFIAQVTA